MGLKTMLSGVASAGIAVGLLGGCGTASRSGPDPVPTWSCTADGSGEPCTEAKAAAQAEEAEAYAEAMHAYREFTKERNRIMAAGGLESPPSEVFERYAAGEYLSFFSEGLALMWEMGEIAEPGVKIEALEPVSVEGDSLILRACEDGRENVITGPTGEVLGVGSRGSVDLHFERLEGRWVIVNFFDSEVELCGA